MILYIGVLGSQVRVGVQRERKRTQVGSINDERGSQLNTEVL